MKVKRIGPGSGRIHLLAEVKRAPTAAAACEMLKQLGILRKKQTSLFERIAVVLGWIMLIAVNLLFLTVLGACIYGEKSLLQAVILAGLSSVLGDAFFIPLFVIGIRKKANSLEKWLPKLNKGGGELLTDRVLAITPSQKDAFGLDLCLEEAGQLTWVGGSTEFCALQKCEAKNAVLYAIDGKILAVFLMKEAAGSSAEEDDAPKESPARGDIRRLSYEVQHPQRNGQHSSFRVKC